MCLISKGNGTTCKARNVVSNYRSGCLCTFSAPRSRTFCFRAASDAIDAFVSEKASLIESTQPKGGVHGVEKQISETVVLSQIESRKIQLSNAQPLADELKDGGHIQAEPCREKYAQLSDAL